MAQPLKYTRDVVELLLEKDSAKIQKEAEAENIEKFIYIIEKEKNRHIERGAIRKRSGKERWEKRRKRVSLSRR